jgi:hypothetical protein
MKGPVNAINPSTYIAGLQEPRKSEIKTLHKLICKHAPDLKPGMWSVGIGYGTYHYKYASGREGDWFVLGVASQKNYISLYTCAAKGDRYITETYKKKLPKANIGKSCIRFRKLEDVDEKAIIALIKEFAVLGKKMIEKGV